MLVTEPTPKMYRNSSSNLSAMRMKRQLEGQKGKNLLVFEAFLIDYHAPMKASTATNVTNSNRRTATTIIGYSEF
jgi:hypothetical protein